MSDDPLKPGRSRHSVVESVHERLDGIHRLTQPAASALAQLNFDLGHVRRIQDTVSGPLGDILRRLNGPQDEFRENMARITRSIAPASDFYNGLTQVSRGIASLSPPIAYQLPGRFDVEQLLPKLPDLSAIYGNRYDLSTVADAMARMRTPWSDAQNALGSLASFARLQEFGQALNSLQPFDGPLTEGLRYDLGDWRDSIIWPTQLTAPERRLELYVSRGFDRELTALEPAAFAESATIAGLGHVVVHRPDPVEDAADDTEVADQHRTETAFQHLHRMEVQLRQFIDRVMTVAHGPDWPRHRLAPKTFEAWDDRRKKTEAEGAPGYPLIFYADFMDYQSIICRQDDWKAIFCPLFGRKESVRESFQRLHPVRVATMHARFVTPDDAVYLLAETLRIMRAIGGSR